MVVSCQKKAERDIPSEMLLGNQADATHRRATHSSPLALSLLPKLLPYIIGSPPHPAHALCSRS